MIEFVTPQDVRDYLKLDSAAGPYADHLLSSNIRTASSFLQRTTRRQFEPQTAVTRKFTTHGKPVVHIPDLRSATSVTLQDSELVLDDTFWLIPDHVEPSVFTAIQVRPFGGNYLSNPSWFDRNLDVGWRRGYSISTLPNDLVIVGDWGHDPYPEDLLHNTKVLASWYTKRPESVLANVQVTLEGTALRYGELPPEVIAFLATWRLEEQAVAVG